jgi:hypothetical protein
MKKFFINYYIGTRGDFLISCLVKADLLIIKSLKNMAKVPPLIYQSAKTHGRLDRDIVTGIDDFPTKVSSFNELFNILDEHGFVKLKIVASDPDEILDAAWFALSKVLIGDVSDIHQMPPEDIPKLTKETVTNYKKDLVHIAHDMIHVQKLDQDNYENYDFIISFRDLFDSKFLGDLYFRVNNEKIGYAHIKAIKTNIDMQERLSKSPYYQEVLDHYNNPIH